MSIDITQVEHIAHLARLALRPEDASRYAAELSRILELVDQMNRRDTRGVTPMANPLDARQRLRADEITESDRRQQLQAVAPATEEGLYLVPRVIE